MSHQHGSPHVTELLAGYSLGVLDDDERQAVAAHLAGCADCQAEEAEATETVALLALIPPDEALRDFGDIDPELDLAALDGPGDAVAEPNQPATDDLVLRRTLRAVRTARRGQYLRRLAATAAGVVTLAAASIGAGYVVGDRTTNPTARPTPSQSATALPGTRVLTASDDATGVAATVTVTPAAGWVRLGVKVTGVAPGELCQLVAVTRSGERVTAGSWVVAAKPAPDAPPVPGAAAVAPTDLVAVEVVTAAGKRLVSVPA